MVTNIFKILNELPEDIFREIGPLLVNYASSPREVFQCLNSVKSCIGMELLHRAEFLKG